jgi:non-haem Fe2+, alpha-ketoglutarate-dependent halogenase
MILSWIKNRLNYLLVFCAFLLQKIPKIHHYLPRKIREILASWNVEMMRTYLESGGQQVYADQPCTLRHPASYEPLVRTEPQYSLSADEIRQFYEDGFLGPFTLCSSEEMSDRRLEIDRQISAPSKVYGRATWRDRHLDCEAVRDLVVQPEVTERFAQFLGEDLLLWRSQMHRKEPGAPGFAWHQASTYLMEELSKPALVPGDPCGNGKADRDALFELTGWLALDDVDLENGSIQFVRGTHRRIHKMTVGGKGLEKFSKVQFKLDAEINPDKVVTAEMKAGQYMIFSERVIHGSQANLSDRRRWGMAFRVVPPTVKVYDDQPFHYVKYLDEQYDLRQWSGLMIRGLNTAGINPIAQQSTAEYFRNKGKSLVR